MRTRVAHAPWSAQSDATRRTELSVNPQFITSPPKFCPNKRGHPLFQQNLRITLADPS
jgi:hypothetical protein